MPPFPAERIALAINTTGRLVMSNEEEADNVLTIDELARYLKISKSTLYKLCQEGQIPGRKIGRHWRFSKVVIDEWIGRRGGANRA